MLLVCRVSGCGSYCLIEQQHTVVITAVCITATNRWLVSTIRSDLDGLVSSHHDDTIIVALFAPVNHLACPFPGAGALGRPSVPDGVVDVVTSSRSLTNLVLLAHLVWMLRGFLIARRDGQLVIDRLVAIVDRYFFILLDLGYFLIDDLVVFDSL